MTVWTRSRWAAGLLLIDAAAYVVGWGIGTAVATADRLLSRASR